MERCHPQSPVIPRRKISNFGNIFAKMFWFEDSGFANGICKLVFEKYKGLGKKGKPAVGREWTILAAVVVVFEQEGQGKRGSKRRGRG